MSTELERARREIANLILEKVFVRDIDKRLADYERLVREDERKKCAEIAWQMQSKEGRSEIGNAITGRAEDKHE